MLGLYIILAAAEQTFYSHRRQTNAAAHTWLEQTWEDWDICEESALLYTKTKTLKLYQIYIQNHSGFPYSSINLYRTTKNMNLSSHGQSHELSQP